MTEVPSERDFPEEALLDDEDEVEESDLDEEPPAGVDAEENILQRPEPRD